MVAGARVKISIQWRRRFAVLAGGGLGAGARYGLSLLITDALIGTFAVNILGAGLLGYVLARLRLAGRSRSISVPLVGVGFLGAFTTFSSFAVQLIEGPLLRSIAYAAASLAAGLIAAGLGLLLGRRQ
jgi:CrcB protein